jgi:hypothetical protein
MGVSFKVEKTSKSTPEFNVVDHAAHNDKTFKGRLPAVISFLIY